MNLATGLTWASTALTFGLDLTAKATALLVIVLVLQNRLGRRRALLGAAVGNAGLIGLLLLPFSSLVLPSVTIACLPTWRNVQTSASSIAPVTSSSIEIPQDLAEDAMRITQAPDRSPIIPDSEVMLDSTAYAYRLTPLSPVMDEAFPVGSSHQSVDWVLIAIAGYALVALVLIARLGASLLAIARLRRSCETVDNTQWIEALNRWRGRLGIGRDVILARSDRVGVPVVLGWLRPTIVLPDSLTSVHADAVLLHELSHVRRGDYPWNLLLRFLQAVYWPHLMVWVLGRAIAEVRERACDDLCVHEMGGASAYRETLLAVASGMIRHPGPALGMAMARRSKLARRLAQIERSQGDARCLPRWPARLIIATTIIALAGVVGTIQLVRTQARAARPQDPAKKPEAAAPLANSGRVFHLQVVAADTGAPVPEADVRVWMALHNDWRKTDAQGRLDITHSTGPSDRNLSVDAWGKGRAMQRYNWGDDPNTPIPDGETIKLQPGETLGGLVQDEQGRPIAGATIYLWSHNYKRKDPHELLFDLRAVTGPDGKWQTSGAPETTGELLGFKIVHPEFLSSRGYGMKEIPKIGDLRTEKAVTVMIKGVTIEGRVIDADGKPVSGARVLSAWSPQNMHTEVDEFAVSTDAQGRFRTGQVKAGEWHLIGMAKGHGPGLQTVKITTAIPQVEITLTKPHVFKGRVLDPDGKPIAGAFVNADTWRGYRCLGAFFWTDAEGRFRWEDAPNDEMFVNVNTPGYRGISMERVAPSSEDVVFTLKPSLAIHGKLTDAETKKRVENATVEYSAIDPKTGEPLKWTSMPRLGGGTGVYMGNLDVNFPITGEVYKIRILSPGYQPFLSRAFRREEKVVISYDVALVPGVGAGRKGTVLRPDGKPLVGARVYSEQHGGEHLNVNDGVVTSRNSSGNGREDRTGSDGTFLIPEFDKAGVVLILGDDSYAIASREALDKSPEVQAKAYGQITGQCFVGKRPGANQPVQLSGLMQDKSTMMCDIFLKHTATTDSEGRFTFKQVIPTVGLRVVHRRPGIWSIGDPVRVKPGEMAKVTVGGKGRPVVGRVEPPENWTKPIDFTDKSAAEIESNLAWSPYPLSLFRGKTSLGEEWSNWLHTWPKSPEGHDYSDRRVAVHVDLAPDGSFRIDDVPPGEYRLGIRVNGTRSNREPSPFTRIVQVFTVPPVAGGQSDESLDLGVLRLRTRFALKVGDPAPAFEVTTVEGKKLAVPGDFQGKFLLIDFGTIWDSQSGIQITRLNDVNQKFGKDPRFTILSLTFAADNSETRKHIEDKGEVWSQAIVGPLSNPISLAYAVDDENVPVTILIGPDGKIVANELYYDKISKAVGKALDRPVK